MSDYQPKHRREDVVVDACFCSRPYCQDRGRQMRDYRLEFTPRHRAEASA